MLTASTSDDDDDESFRGMQIPHSSFHSSMIAQQSLSVVLQLVEKSSSSLQSAVCLCFDPSSFLVYVRNHEIDNEDNLDFTFSTKILRPSQKALLF